MLAGGGKTRTFWPPLGARACVAGTDSAQSGAARASLDLALMIVARCLVSLSVYA